MSRSYTRWTKDLLEPIVQNSLSYAECLRKMNLREAGGNYKNLQKNIDTYNFDTSHMVHQVHNKGKEFVPLEELKRSAGVKSRLLKELGHVCQRCNATTWQGEPVPLELEHIDGNNRNTTRENLTLLCCNCHALTPTWRNRKR